MQVIGERRTKCKAFIFAIWKQNTSKCNDGGLKLLNLSSYFDNLFNYMYESISFLIFQFLTCFFKKKQQHKSQIINIYTSTASSTMKSYSSNES
jgi:hypothetical protein